MRTDQVGLKSVEQALTESEARYNDLLKSLPNAVYTCDAAGRIQTYNDAAVDLWGREPVVGKDTWCGSWKIFDPINGESIPQEKCPMAIALKEGHAVLGMEIVVERPDGTRRTVAPHPIPLFDPAGKLLGAVNMLVDISSQKEAAQALRKSEEQFRAIAELVPIVIWMSDREGNFTYLNNRWIELTGREVRDGYGNHWVDMVHPADSQRAHHEFMKALAERKAYSSKFRYRNKDNTYAICNANGTPRFDELGGFLGYIGVLQNIEQQVQSQSNLESKVKERTEALIQRNEELRRSEERYHRMISEVQDYAIILLSTNGVIENWNKGAEKIKGYKAGEAVGKHFRIFYSPEDQERHLPEQLLLEAIHNGKAEYEGWRIRKDGSKFWGNIVLTALHDEINNIIGFSKVTRDLTERKATQDVLEEKNRELEKINQELSAFAYVSSHDLQEPLRKIQTFSTRILELEEKFTEKGRDYFNRIQLAASRMRGLIEDLLTYSRANVGDRDMAATDVNQLLLDVIGELSETIQEKHVQLEYSSLPQMKVIPFQFRQLMFNLINNALKFSKKDIAPHIIIKADVVSGDKIQAAGKKPHKLYHHISISDNGIGFESTHNIRIFEIFQRLHDKSEYEGTGIGLAICKKIVGNLGGIITAEGKVNEGAIFHIYLPA